MALVRPITGATIQNFIIAGGNDPNDITDIKDYIRPLAIDTDGKIRRIRAIIQNIADHFIPEYIVLLNTILFFNTTSAPVTYVTFANRIVDIEANWITQYLDVTRADNTIQTDLRNRLIKSLIDEYVQQYVDPTKDTRVPLIALLENSRLQRQPEFIQYAVSASYNGAKIDLQIEITEKYRNDQPYIDLLVNGVIESTVATRFQDLNQLLEDIDGVPGSQIPGAPPGTVYGDRRRLVGRDLTAADADTIHDLQRHAAYALTPVNLALVLQPPNIVHVPLLLPFLQTIRDAVTNMTATSPFPATFATIPGHYFDLLTGVTMAEKAAALGNVAIMNGLLAAGINVTAKPLMRIALTGGHYAIAQALWNHDPNYPDPWFPPGFIVTPALSTTSSQFQTVFNAKYAIFNPGARSQTAIGRAGAAAAAALGIPQASQPALSLAEQQTRADAAIRLLTAMPDFVPNSTKDTLNLLTLSSIRDELARITDPTVWDAKMLLPLIAKKGAVADGTLLPKADLLATGLANGADPNVVDTTGSTALHYVATIPVLPRVVARTTTPRSILMLKTLLAAPTLDVNKVNANHETALYLIVSKAQPSLEHLTLLSRAPKLDFNVVDAAGNTALTYLILQHPVGGPNPSLFDLNDVVQILLKGSDMTVKDNTGHTALWNAINTYTDDAYLSTIVVDLAKGLPDVASELAVAVAKGALLPLTRAKLAGINGAAAAAAAVSARPLPGWLPDEYKAILSDDTLDAEVKVPILKHIQDLDNFITTGPPSLSDAIMKELADSSFWWGVRSVKAYPIPVLSAIPVVGVLAKGPMFYDANQATTFDVKFQDNSQYTLRTPYKAPYRALATTIYNPNGTPTLAATATPADRTAAQANNDVLVKLVGRQYITTANQRFLKKILDELYYSQFNPSLGNDPLTALLHLRSKLDSLLKYHGLAQANAKQATLTKLGTTLTTFITNLISGVGLRFPTTVPLPMAFPPITFVGTSPHAAAFVAAAGAIGGIIPIVPGLRAGILVPPPRGGLRALGGLGGLGSLGPSKQPNILQNIFTGDLVSSAILATNYPTAITLGPEDAMTYLPAPLGPIAAANGFAVAKSDLFYKFLTPFGLTAVVRGQGYILRPAELFIALFHQPAVAVAAIVRDRNHPFVRLLRDYCIPAAAGLATHKAMPSVVTELNRLRGKLPV